MAQMEPQEESPKTSTEELTEEEFLKNLYIFMKKRDTPIERIPNLGFKQIDLFLMFKTVSDLGGYHQVTSHQLWKRVYNTLGGNPRSTSAATCTRRHYEKLLLPYECHLKGVLMSTVPHHQQRPYRYNKDDDGGQRPSKRRLSTLPPGPHCFQSDPHGNLYPLPLQYHHYYHPAHPLLPSYVPIAPSAITPHGPPAPKLVRFPIPQTHEDLTDFGNGPLQKLRNMAEQYKISSGLSTSEPLNLSKKASAQESNTNPASSFSPPSSSKNPRFLNKPSTLYTRHPGGTVRSEGNETEDDESSKGVLTLSESEKQNETHDASVKAPSPSDSPIFISALMPELDKDAIVATPKPSSLKAEFPVQPAKDRDGRTDVEGFNLSHVLPRIASEKEGKMEIEVPLSVFRNWLKLYGPSSKLPEAKELLASHYVESLGKKSLLEMDISPTDLRFHSPQDQSSAEDLRLRPKPSLVPNTEKENDQDCHFTSCKTSGGLPRKGGAGEDIWPVNQQDINMSYKLKSTDLWDTYSKETMLPHSLTKPNSSLPRVQAPKFYIEDLVFREGCRD
ncbi:AT-rich interactive domain-containing protein 5B-like [Fundulus heteroclitus]|uniref:AT-rich interactive domain-containing protein 5B-like n=1 Tax=Fundulus heteroclitus TaxID=8078 RepID=UPI00165B8E80|nr:AT-rich interactive domain-containing protein 5B-like [Fundulus heteroclitus]XP_035996334.1 AT-rich interactive domain-containing protein 5B-like [Fundulus heteroclitus]XP_035996335.1 AT-rich interactive domain-containing protein 5B-like [Fundulus heteroclitus]XP_035996336.1 AT-rich interactive domain-containing protein 5B-like [Fundulus heteroclitus]